MCKNVKEWQFWVRVLGVAGKAEERIYMRMGELLEAWISPLGTIKHTALRGTDFHVS